MSFEFVAVAIATARFLRAAGMHGVVFRAIPLVAN